MRRILYDDFNGQKIDPAKWSDSSSTYWVREMVRELSPAYQGQGSSQTTHWGLHIGTSQELVFHITDALANLAWNVLVEGRCSDPKEIPLRY